MQRYNPPFIPRVKSWEDTKYFDDEGPVSDIDSATSEDDYPLEVENHPLNTSCHQQEAQGIIPETPAIEKGLIENPLAMVNGTKKPQEKKRPRDKVLRDATCGRMALQMRKNDAFNGYSYYRAKGVTEIIDEVLAEEGVLGASDVTIRNGQC